LQLKKKQQKKKKKKKSGLLSMSDHAAGCFYFCNKIIFTTLSPPTHPVE
jgi:hypothetical protein